MLTAQQAPERMLPLKSWAAPMYWHPNQAERAAAAQALPQNAVPQVSVDSASSSTLYFVAITPCRLVDTRGAAAGFVGMEPFSGPSVPGGGIVTFPVQSALEAIANSAPAPCGVIPSLAGAYSVNVTVAPRGGGAVNYLSLWAAGSAQPKVATLNDPQGLIVASSAVVGAGILSGGVSLYNSGPATTDVIIDMNGFFVAPNYLNGDTSIGPGTLSSDTSGSYNTADGANVLYANTTGGFNTASGEQALEN